MKPEVLEYSEHELHPGLKFAKVKIESGEIVWRMRGKIGNIFIVPFEAEENKFDSMSHLIKFSLLIAVMDYK